MDQQEKQGLFARWRLPSSTTGSAKASPGNQHQVPNIQRFQAVGFRRAEIRAD
jgi:hypothetical protein